MTGAPALHWALVDDTYHAMPSELTADLSERDTVTALCALRIATAGLLVEAEPATTELCTDCLAKIPPRWALGADGLWHAYRPAVAGFTLCQIVLPPNLERNEPAPAGRPCIECLVEATDGAEDPGRMGTAL